MWPYLHLLLCLAGIHSLDTFRGPLYGVTCPRGALSCEVEHCGFENFSEDLPNLRLTNLTTSTILHCEKNTCSPCIRVQLTASLAGVENHWSLDENGSGSEESRDEDYNEGWVTISTSQPEGGMNQCAKILFALSRSRPTATVELSCFRAAMSSEVRVKASTNTTVLQSTHKVEDCSLKDFLENIEWCKVPKINITLEKELQMAVVNIPQNYCIMFKHEVMPAFESKNPLDCDKLEMPTVYRNFSDIVPCLCIELWSTTIADARRRKQCPFSDEFEGNVWRLSRLAVEYKGKALQWTLSSPCNMSGEIMLCSKSGDGESCQEIPHSRQNFQVNTLSEFKSVDPHPSLCVKIISGEHVNLSCPFDRDVSTPWRVESRLEGSNVIMTISHVIIHMNFSICNMEGNECEHFLQKIQQVNQLTKQIDLISQDCLQIWRSDVKFSPRITLCPIEMYARARWTPLMVLFLIPLVVIVIAIGMVKKEILKGCTEVIKWDYNTTPTGSPRKILLLYSADHSWFENLVNTFASALVDLNIKVVVDLWKRREIGIQGTLPWFHSQKTKIAEEGGKIIILFSKGSSIKYNAWLNSSGDSETLSDPYDGFMAALNCVLPDVTKGNVSGNYVVAYFEDLLNKEYIPEIFRKIPIYSLPSQVPEFLREIGLPAKCISDQKKHGCPSNISRRLRNVIKECQIWEQSHSTGFHELKKFENTSKEHHESDALIELPLTKVKNLSIV
ncbi:interleukin-17 receptor C-like [Rhinoraja longicauda]